MSKLIKAIADMIDSYQGNSKKGTEAEKFKRSEFKKLIHQELSPVKISSSSKYKHIKNLPDSDMELMNEKEIQPCVY
uniref:Uncharacterized protein n=1 Tax=Sphenodon punctatus TaxID=8508 RepID=A0A8D0GJP5_SPHPU